MNSQKGSVLVGVLGLCVAITIAASGLITTAANVSGTEIDSGRDLQLHYAAEAGMQMGVRWTRAFAYADVSNSAWPAGQPAFVVTRGDAGFETINGMKVKVVFLSGVAGGGVHTLQIIAKDPTRPRGTLEINWQINSADPSSPLPLKSKPNLAKWKEFYHPYDT
jgi:hypothetical protein